MDKEFVVVLTASAAACVLLASQVVFAAYRLRLYGTGRKFLHKESPREVPRVGRTTAAPPRRQLCHPPTASSEPAPPLTRVSAMSNASDMSHVPPQHIVICGAGLHGSALAYYLTLFGHKNVTVIERESVAAAASGKGGGFLARDWGSGPTRQLHHVSFDLHAELAETLGIETYRRIPVLSVDPGERKSSTESPCPWLDGDFASAEVMDADGGAQVAPKELCCKLMDAAVAQGAKLVIGEVRGIETTPAPDGDGSGQEKLRQVTGVRFRRAGHSADEEEVLGCDAAAICMGPWSVKAEDWLPGAVSLPITGIKSTSLIYEAPQGATVEPYALFCGEDNRFGTHLEVYPRTSGQVYICGVGGSEYVEPERLRAGEYPPSDVPADPTRVAAAARSFATMAPRFGDEPTHVQACMRPCAPDALPIMGKVPSVRGAYVSCAHNCWGILWAPVSGKSMAELIYNGAPACVDLSPFTPSRFMTRASGGRGRRKGDKAVGEQW